MSFEKDRLLTLIRNSISILNENVDYLNQSYYSNIDDRQIHQLYEFQCYVKILILFEEVGWTLNIPNYSQSFVFSGGPSFIKNKESYIICEAHLGMFELHMNLKVVGSSEALHEADILLIEQEGAQRARNHNASPVFNRRSLLIECKHYKNNLGIGVARGILGLCKDLNYEANSNIYLVTTRINDSARNFLEYHGCNVITYIEEQEEGNEFIQIVETFLDPIITI